MTARSLPVAQPQPEQPFDRTTAIGIGALVIAVLIRYLERGTFKIFVVYRVALGVLVFVLGWGLRHT